MDHGIPARLSPSEGRKFALTVGGAFLVLAGLLYFWRHATTSGAICAFVGGSLVLAGLLVPGRLGPVHAAWMALAAAISRVTTPVFLGVVFFGVMTPIGLLMRLTGRRPLLHSDGDSFWVEPSSGSRSDLERQF